MKNIVVLIAFAFAFVNLTAAKNEITIKKLGENSASFIAGTEKGRTVLVLYPSTEMLPQIDLSMRQELEKETADISELKPIKNNAYIVFDGTQSAIPITIKGLKPNSTYFLALLKPDEKQIKQFELEFSTLAPEPKKQASGIAFRQPTESVINIILNKGDGEGRIVVATKGKGKVDPPADGTEYKANAKFGSAESKVGDNSFVVFSGDKNECKIENLQPATVYNFQVFEFKGKGKSTNYNTTVASGNPRTKMTAIPAPEVLPAKDVHEIGFTALWKSSGEVEKFIIDIAYDEEFTKFAETYEGADVGKIEEIEVMDLDPKKQWYFRVRAVGEGTVSQNSKVLKVKK